MASKDTLKKPLSPDEEEDQDLQFRTMRERIAAARAAAGPEVDEAQFSAAEKEAKDLYKQQADRNEWLSLADRISGALVRYGAARAGQKSGVDMTQIDYGPKTDWQGKTAMAGKDYDRELERIGRSRQAALTKQRDNYDLADKALGYEIMSERDKLAAERSEKAAERADVRAGRAEAARDARQGRQLQAQEEALLKRLKVQEEKAEREDQRALRNASLKDIELGEGQEQKKLKAQQTLFNNLMTDPDITNKDRSKLEAQYGRLAGEAGVDLADLQGRLSGEETGWFGRSKEEDNKAKAAVLQSELQKQKNLLDALAERKRQLLQSAPVAPAAAAPEGTAPDAPPPEQKEPTEEQVQKYMSMYPQVSKEQATEILKKRLNGG